MSMKREDITVSDSLQIEVIRARRHPLAEDDLPIDHSGSVKDPYDGSYPKMPKNRWTKTGICNKCAVCCTDLVYHPRMANPETGKGCRFVREDNLCAIRYWVEGHPEIIEDWKASIGSVDFPVDLPECDHSMDEYQFHYWRIECSRYPNPEAASHTERFWRKDDTRGFMKRLFRKCGYDMEEST